jgi:hypothetical protein
MAVQHACPQHAALTTKLGHHIDHEQQTTVKLSGAATNVLSFVLLVKCFIDMDIFPVTVNGY